ncbi:MAG: lactoylglutathione lyase [Acidobacteria bacterium]|nr:MAG: lactoylglutathione lyase [Acidobacteriota bacterium]
MARNSVGWFEIYVDDMARARKFYETVLSVPLSKLEGPDVEMYAFPGEMEAAGAPGSLVHMPGFPVGQNSVIVYFSCEDCANEESRVVSSGGKIQKEKFSIGPYGFISLVYDTEGNMFGLHSIK